MQNWARGGCCHPPQTKRCAKRVQQVREGPDVTKYDILFGFS
jgi:hypothetical protein